MIMDSLRETALLGTEKKPLDVLALPESIKTLMHEHAQPDSELQFLKANAYLSFYQQAGATPRPYTGPWDETTIEEQKPVGAEALLQLYGKFDLVDYQIRERVLNLWLTVLIDAGRIVSPTQIVDLIQQGKNFSNQTKSKIVQVIGNKGIWTLQYDRSLNYSIPMANDYAWNEGSSQERKQVFSSLRKTDADASIRLLRSTWPTEPVVTKKAFLEIIQQTSVASDLPFIGELYADEFTYQPKEKKTDKECRRICASILLKYPDTDLYKQTAKGLEPYFTKGKKGIIGLVTGKEKISFDLPDVEDDFWNARVMEQRYGFETKGYDIARFSTVIQHWLSGLLEYLPLQFWVDSFGSDRRRTIQYWLNNDRYKTKVSGQSISIFEPALIAQAKNFNDADAAAVLADILDRAESIQLLQYMHRDAFESHIIKSKLFDDPEVLANGPFDIHHSWSFAFSEKIISNALDLANLGKASAALGKVMAQYAHEDSIDILYKYNEKARETTGYHQWNINIFQISQPALEIRKKINTYKKQNP